MKKWKLVTGVALVFVLGVVVGSLGTEFYHKYLFARHKKDPSARKVFILKRFSRDLDLREDQKNEFKSIIDQLENKREALFQHGHSEFVKMMDQGFLEMKKVLSPDQQKKFDEMLEKFKRRKKSRHKFGPPRRK